MRGSVTALAVQKFSPAWQKVRKGGMLCDRKNEIRQHLRPKNDLDRMVNQYLSHYEIQLENALTELRSASKLEPYPGTNPYREPLQKAQKLLASCPGAKQQEISTGTCPWRTPSHL